MPVLISSISHRWNIISILKPASAKLRRWGPRWTRCETRSTKKTLVSCRIWGVSSRGPIRTAGFYSIVWGRRRGKGCAMPRQERSMRSCSGVWSRTWRYGGEGALSGCSFQDIWIVSLQRCVFSWMCMQAVNEVTATGENIAFPKWLNGCSSGSCAFYRIVFTLYGGL